MNLRELLRRREILLDAVRGFFKSRGFVEAETPLIVPSPGLEPHLDPFEVRNSAGRHAGFLPTSPEYAMKKLLAAGSGDIFQLARAFRDEPPAGQHLPEFTMLEWYRVGADYRVLMEDCEELVGACARAVCGGNPVVRRGRRVELGRPWERLTLRDGFRRWAGLDLTFGESLDELRSAARRARCPDISPDDDWDEVFFKLFLRHVEPNVGVDRPTILYDYPARMAALARFRRDDPLACERFEVYAGGLELANAFSELTDAAEQRRRFESDNALRRELGKPELPIDEEFLAALESGLPDCAGIALGFDRLLMLLSGADDIGAVAAGLRQNF